MENTTYNGWTNYETWLYKLWMDNDGNATEYYQEIAKEQEMDVYDLSEYIKEEAEAAADEIVSGNVFADLLNAAVSKVNFYEISESIFEDIEEEAEDEQESEEEQESEDTAA